MQKAATFKILHIYTFTLNSLQIQLAKRQLRYVCANAQSPSTHKAGFGKDVLSLVPWVGGGGDATYPGGTEQLPESYRGPKEL